MPDEADEEVVVVLGSQGREAADQKRHQGTAGADLLQRVQGRDDAFQGRPAGAEAGSGLRTSIAVPLCGSMAVPDRTSPSSRGRERAGNAKVIRHPETEAKP